MKKFIVKFCQDIIESYFLGTLSTTDAIMNFVFSKEIKNHKDKGLPVLALESTILAHGMPYPDNYNFAKEVEKNCRDIGVAPATIAVLDGRVHVGLNDRKLKTICNSKKILKISKRDLPFAIAKSQSGATTVSATIWVALKAGISVFSTGGIGGVHRGVEEHFDVSQDLKALSETPIVVVSAGAKAILDLPKTIENLESLGVPIIGYKTGVFPAFYSRSSGVRIHNTLTTVKEIAQVFLKHLEVSLQTSLLIVNPIPEKDEIPKKKINSFISDAVIEAEKLEISGKELTPFLLKTVEQKSRGESLRANISLAKNNISLGAKIAKEVALCVNMTRKDFWNTS